MAIGDLDNDKSADIVTVNSAGTEFTVHFYLPGKREF